MERGLSCESDKLGIIIKGIILLFMIWIISLLVQEFTGRSLASTIELITYMLVVSVIGIGFWLVPRRSNSNPKK